MSYNYHPFTKSGQIERVMARREHNDRFGTSVRDVEKVNAGEMTLEELMVKSVDSLVVEASLGFYGEPSIHQRLQQIFN